MKIDEQFALDEDVIYLNHAAVAPWPKCTALAVAEFCRENVSIGSKLYANWLKKEEFLKTQICQLINAASTDEIALVKNTSEAISFVAYGLDWQAGDVIVTSDEEFPSNMIPWESLENKGVELVKVDLKSVDDPTATLIEALSHEVKLLAISSIQYASGIRVDLERLGEVCAEKNILFSIDAIQTVGAFTFDVQRYKADFVMADGHKWMLGPEGLGFFYCKKDIQSRLKLTQYGWHMVEDMGNYDATTWSVASSARRFECGSPNMLSIHALSASLTVLLDVGLDNVEKKVCERAQYVIDKINKNKALSIISKVNSRGNNIIVFKPNEASVDALFAFLTAQGVVCAKRGGGIRFSPHFYTPYKKIDDAFDLIDQFLS